MKKIILHTILGVAVFSPSQAAVFNGYSVGLTAGVLMTKDKTKVDLQMGRRKYTPRYTANLNSGFGAYGIHFDYDRSQSNAFYWGTGLDFMIYSPASKKATYWLVEDKVYKNNAYERTKYSWSTELDGKIGWNLENRVALYALAGLRLYNKKTSGQFNNTNECRFKPTNRNHLTPVLGAGLKYKITDHTSTGIEYRYAFARSERSTHKPPLGGDTSLDRHNKHSSQAVLAKLSYHF